jgi:hypothetical protein
MRSSLRFISPFPVARCVARFQIDARQALSRPGIHCTADGQIFVGLAQTILPFLNAAQLMERQRNIRAAVYFLI